MRNQIFSLRYWYQPGFLAFPNQQKLTRGQINSGKALLGPLLWQEGAWTSTWFPCTLAPWVAASLSFVWGEGRGVPRRWVEGWLGCSAHPSGDGECRGHAQYPVFAPGSSKVTSFLVFCIFWSNIWPNYLCMRLFLVNQIFVFCCFRRGLSRCKRWSTCSKGFQVPACLNITSQLKSVCESLSHVRLFATPWTGARQAPLSIEFSRPEYWSGLPFPSPGDLSDPGIEPRSLAPQMVLCHLSHHGSPN